MKFIKIAGVTAIVLTALAVLGVSLVLAQQPTPTETPWWSAMRNMMQGNGSGMMGRSWNSMQQMHNQMTQNRGMNEMHRQMTEFGGMGATHEWMHQSGGMHDTVWAALADQLGTTTEDLASRIASGETLAQVAEEKGVAVKDLASTMEAGMKAGLEQAVKDGALTQEQADLMLQHMDGQYEWMVTNMGPGMMGPGNSYKGFGGMMGPNGLGGCHDTPQNTEDNTTF